MAFHDLFKIKLRTCLDTGLPTGIISSGFMEEINSRNKPQIDTAHICPHCKKEIEDI